MPERVDAVVIGAGLGGLAAAVVLAGAGREVVVLEQGSSPGGYARGFQRGPYRFDVSLHALNRLAPGGGADTLYRELGIWDRLRLHRLDPLYRVLLPDREVVAHADLFRYESELIGHFPGAAEGIRSYLDEALAVYHDTRRMTEDAAAGRRPALAEAGRHYPSLVAVTGRTWEQMMSRHVRDPRTRTAMAALWVYVGLPPSLCGAQVGAGLTGAYHEHGAWYPDGGSGALSDALAKVLAEQGGSIRFSRAAAQVEVDGGHAVAVTTRDGQRVETDTVISNASAPATMLSMVGRGRLPADYADRVTALVPSLSTVTVYLGLRRDVFAGPGHELILAGYDPTESWDAAQRGDWERAPLIITDYARTDPGCSPPGHAAVVLSAAASWDYEDIWGTGGDLAGYHENPRYRRIRDHVTDALVARATRAVPGLRGTIAHRETSTPLTNHHYTLNPRGAIMGYENTPANTGLGSLPQRTPIANLYLCGAWAGAGGMNQALASGARAARMALSAPARSHA